MKKYLLIFVIALLIDVAIMVPIRNLLNVTPEMFRYSYLIIGILIFCLTYFAIRKYINELKPMLITVSVILGGIIYSLAYGIPKVGLSNYMQAGVINDITITGAAILAYLLSLVTVKKEVKKSL